MRQAATRAWRCMAHGLDQIVFLDDPIQKIRTSFRSSAKSRSCQFHARGLPWTVRKLGFSLRESGSDRDGSAAAARQPRKA